MLQYCCTSESQDIWELKSLCIIVLLCLMFMKISNHIQTSMPRPNSLSPSFFLFQHFRDVYAIFPLWYEAVCCQHKVFISSLSQHVPWWDMEHFTVSKLYIMDYISVSFMAYASLPNCIPLCQWICVNIILLGTFFTFYFHPLFWLQCNMSAFTLRMKSGSSLVFLMF